MRVRPTSTKGTFGKTLLALFVVILSLFTSNKQQREVTLIASLRTHYKCMFIASSARGARGTRMV